MSDLEEDTADLFREPDDWKPVEKKPTFTDYILQSGEKLNLRLVGHNPLWVSNASRLHPFRRNTLCHSDPRLSS